MRKYQKTFLASVAAGALIAGAGFASAQEKSGAPAPQASQPKAAQPQAAQPKGATPPAGQAERQGGQPNAKAPGGPSSAQNEKERGEPNAKAPGGPSSAQNEKERGEPNAKAPGGPSNAQRQTNPNNEHAQNPNGARNAAQEPRGAGSQTKGGPAVNLTEQQRTRIRETVIGGSGAPRVGSVDFDVTVGTVVPRERVHIVPVPETLVQIEPQWRGFLYFVYQDEVVVVDPNDGRIVAILSV